MSETNNDSASDRTHSRKAENVDTTKCPEKEKSVFKYKITKHYLVKFMTRNEHESALFYHANESQKSGLLSTNPFPLNVNVSECQHVLSDEKRLF